MSKNYKTTFLLRRGEAEAWAKNNPILMKGEPGFDLTNHGLKIGDGKTPWNELEFISLGGEIPSEPGEGTSFETDETLKLENGILSVNTTNAMEADNTLPITSAGVFATVGNIEALLKTI